MRSRDVLLALFFQLFVDSDDSCFAYLVLMSVWLAMASSTWTPGPELWAEHAAQEQPDRRQDMPKEQKTNKIGPQEQRDRRQHLNAEAKLDLENYCNTARNFLEDKQLEHRFKNWDKRNIEKALDFTWVWLAENQHAERAVIVAKHMLLEEVVNPIVMRIYGFSGEMR